MVGYFRNFLTFLCMAAGRDGKLGRHVYMKNPADFLKVKNGFVEKVLDLCDTKYSVSSNHICVYALHRHKLTLTLTDLINAYPQFIVHFKAFCNLSNWNVYLLTCSLLQWSLYFQNLYLNYWHTWSSIFDLTKSKLFFVCVSFRTF